MNSGGRRTGSREPTWTPLRRTRLIEKSTRMPRSLKALPLYTMLLKAERNSAGVEKYSV